MHPLAALDNLDSYRRLFTDVPLWTPYVQEVLARHDLRPDGPTRTGVPGTCPVFIAGERWVVKFFGRLFDGAASFAVEREANRTADAGLSGDHNPRIRPARLAAAGALFHSGEQGWHWPYLVFEYIPSISMGAAREQACFEDRLRAAAELGETTRWLHALPIEDSAVFPNSHQPYLDFLIRQRTDVTSRQREWGSLPARLIAQIEDFLPPVEALVDTTRPPHLIHADLTADHLLGRLNDDRWTSLALIDFGDARTGSLLYELCALHADLFRWDSRLLAAFLEAYGISIDADLPRNLLATMLLHQFNMFFGIEELLAQAGSLNELAAQFYRQAGD